MLSSISSSSSTFSPAQISIIKTLSIPDGHVFRHLSSSKLIFMAHLPRCSFRCWSYRPSFRCSSTCCTASYRRWIKPRSAFSPSALFSSYYPPNPHIPPQPYLPILLLPLSPSSVERRTSHWMCLVGRYTSYPSSNAEEPSHSFDTSPCPLLFNLHFFSYLDTSNSSSWLGGGGLVVSNLLISWVLSTYSVSLFCFYLSSSSKLWIVVCR